MSAEFEKIVLEKFDELKTEVISLSKKVDNLDVKVNNLDTKVNTIEQKVDQQGLNFAEFENEFNIKVQALFDSFVANTESHLSFTKAIAALNAENFHQGIRISQLEKLNNSTNILATN